MAAKRIGGLFTSNNSTKVNLRLFPADFERSLDPVRVGDHDGNRKRLIWVPPGRLNRLIFRMVKWIKDRLEIIQLTLPAQKLLGAFGLLQLIQFYLVWAPPGKLNPFLARYSTLVPWYGWVIGWLLLLWIASIEYSIERKEVFDRTSLSFFKAFLEFLIQEGNNLFNDAEDKNFYSRIKFWQHRVILGIAIGLGPEESEKYYQKIDSQYSVTAAYRQSLDQKTNEPLGRALQNHIEELNRIRMNLTETKIYEKGDLEALKDIKPVNGASPEGKGDSQALQIRR